MYVGKDQWGAAEPDIRKPFKSALKKLHLFPNLSHFKLNLPEVYLQHSDSGYDGYLEFNHSVLRAVFGAISRDKCPNIYSLTIDHGLADDDIPWTRAFKMVMGQITELRINFAIWDREDHSCWERMEGFPRQWLSHAAGNLTFLEINNDRCGSGYNPALRLVAEDVVFCHLDTLILHKYCFGKEEQFKWIYSHATTLQNLQLIDCVIISHTSIANRNLHNYTEIYEFPPSNVTVDPWHTAWQFTYSRRWHQVFDKILKQLPELNHFEFWAASGHGDCYEIAVPEDAYGFKKAYVRMGHPNGHALDVCNAERQDIADLELDIVSLQNLCDALKKPDIWSDSGASSGLEDAEDTEDMEDSDYAEESGKYLWGHLR